ncbi:MAG: patatin-like phospholipase family protein [Gammaproteobacteria bacterium]|nr:MAG: patatin-like phospholipase family protein [Gammaproteobacteria bacterium]
MATRALASLPLVLILAACTASFPVNRPLDSYDPNYGYRVPEERVPGKSEQLFLALTFSGGGTRAAALSYGILEALARTEVTIEGRRRRLLDEVDIISSVSGGSFTAGYYGLFGDRIFQDFEERFLKKNIDKKLTLKLFSPVNWFRLGSRNFARSDLAAEYYDKYIFEGATFDQIIARGGPGIVINATDIVLGTQFGFTQAQFDWICSNLSGFPVARAVAASSAFPLAMTPIALKNYAGRCNYRPPPWFNAALDARDTMPQRYKQADSLFTYLDRLERPYIHLVDGGLSDNLGLLGVLKRVSLEGGAWNVIRAAGLDRTRRVVFIVVNAQSVLDVSLNQQQRAPKINQVARAASVAFINNTNFDTITSFKQNIPRWRDEIRASRCRAQGEKPSARGGKPKVGACDDFDIVLVDVDLDELAEQKERVYLEGLPTGFHLQPEDVDRLRNAATKILANSSVYQEFLGELR